MEASKIIKRRRKATDKQQDREIELAYYKLAEGVQIDIMKIAALFDSARQDIAGGMPLARAVAVAALRFCEPRETWRIAHRYALSLGHAVQSCETAHECAICGAYGTRSPLGLVGAIFDRTCKDVQNGGAL